MGKKMIAKTIQDIKQTLKTRIIPMLPVNEALRNSVREEIDGFEFEYYLKKLLTGFFDFVDKEAKREGVTLEELERDALVERFLKEGKING